MRVVMIGPIDVDGEFDATRGDRQHTRMNQRFYCFRDCGSVVIWLADKTKKLPMCVKSLPD